jgi:sec-independent protein translocase protein TatC
MSLLDSHRTHGDGPQGPQPPDPLQHPGAPVDLHRAGEMSWLEHLSELRKRLLICITALLLASVAAWFLYNDLIAFMVAPYHNFLRHHPSKDISLGNLVTTGPLEGFTTKLKVSAYLGAVFAAPVLLWELWQFVAPGLYRRERRYGLSFMCAAIVLFAMGVATAVAVFPKAIDWMISVSGTGVTPLFSPSKYFGLYALCCVIFGAVFTYPVVLAFLELIGVLPTTKLRHWRRYAIVVICIVAAVITPSNDPFSFLAMALPMLMFYEGSILFGRAMHK